MSNKVALQANVDALGIQGFGAFKAVLSAVTADNVAPMAVIQAEQLGSMFLTNGKFARTIPDLLQRCESFRLEKLALSIGWRRGDSPSLLSNTAGGQAISLLIACLMNLGPKEDTGEIMFKLCARLIPYDTNIASPLQLADVAHCVFAKVQSMGFTHHLAEVVTRVRQVYLSLDQQAPPDLVDAPVVDSMTEFLEILSLAGREEKTVARITGGRGIVLLASMALAICPNDVVLLVEGIIIQQGSRENVVIDIRNAKSHEDLGPSIQLETQLSKDTGIVPRKSIEIQGHEYSYQHYVYNWEGCLSDMIKFAFSEHGVQLPSGLSQLVGDLIVEMHYAYRFREVSDNGIRLRVSLLLGAHPEVRLRKFCEQTLGVRPSKGTVSLDQSIERLVERLINAVDEARGGANSGDQTHLIYRTLLNLIMEGFLLVFLIPGNGATIPSPLPNAHSFSWEYPAYEKSATLIEWRGLLLPPKGIVIDPEILASKLLTLIRADRSLHLVTSLSAIDETTQLPRCAWKTLDFGTGSSFGSFRSTSTDNPSDIERQTIGEGDGARVMYPAILERLEVHEGDEIGFGMRLEAGCYQLNGRSYRKLLDGEGFHVLSHRLPCLERPLSIIPSNSGVHSEMMVSATERHNGINIHLRVRVQGHITGLCIWRHIRKFYMIGRLSSCNHPLNSPLATGVDLTVAGVERTTRTIVDTSTRSIELPISTHGPFKLPIPRIDDPHKTKPSIWIAMTKGSPEARFLCLNLEDSILSSFWNDYTFLQAGTCCLTCAFKQTQLLTGRFVTILT
ncbi:MAG: hypothetical protein M1812_001685 [Candelaria pacifica]|nr:MAG: hypothetical protein M1812_001685 [Candelaria pacifica]